MKRVKTMVFAVLVSMILSGCIGGSGSGAFVPETSSIYVTKDGTIFSAMVESYEGEHYRSEEFHQFLTEEVSFYNASQGAASAAQNAEGEALLPVSLVSSELKEGKAVAVYQYRDRDCFLDFSQNYNGVLCQVSNLETNTVSNGKDKGWLSKNEWRKVKRNGEIAEVESGEMSKLIKERIILVETENPVLIQIEGTILYMTKDLSLTGKNTAQIPAGTHYIIFK